MFWQTAFINKRLCGVCCAAFSAQHMQICAQNFLFESIHINLVDNNSQFVSLRTAAGNEPTPAPIGKNTIGNRPVPPPKPVNHHPPYRMPPQPAQNGSYGEATIPGTATSTEQQNNSAVSLRTHSSKFPVSFLAQFRSREIMITHQRRLVKMSHLEQSALCEMEMRESIIVCVFSQHFDFADRTWIDSVQRQSVVENSIDARSSEHTVWPETNSRRIVATTDGIHCARSSAKTITSLGKWIPLKSKLLQWILWDRRIQFLWKKRAADLAYRHQVYSLRFAHMEKPRLFESKIVCQTQPPVIIFNAFAHLSVRTKCIAFPPTHVFGLSTEIITPADSYCIMWTLWSADHIYCLWSAICMLPQYPRHRKPSRGPSLHTVSRRTPYRNRAHSHLIISAIGRPCQFTGP